MSFANFKGDKQLRICPGQYATFGSFLNSITRKTFQANLGTFSQDRIALIKVINLEL